MDSDHEEMAGDRSRFPGRDRRDDQGHPARLGARLPPERVRPGAVRRLHLEADHLPALRLARTVQARRTGLGRKANPQFTVIPPSEGPRRSEADLLADKGGYVWGEVDSTGCRHFKSWLGNLTDGTARLSIHNGPRAKAIASVRQLQETEGNFQAKIDGVTRLRLQATDVKSGYGPYISVDSYLLCTN